MESKRRKTPNVYTAEFKAGAVRLVIEEHRVAEQVCRELGIASSTLSKWLHQARMKAEPGSKEALTLEEKQELHRLRKEVRQLQMERDILKKATSFFAKESR